jgi:hypothetical protein
MIADEMRPQCYGGSGWKPNSSLGGDNDPKTLRIIIKLHPPSI